MPPCDLPAFRELFGYVMHFNLVHSFISFDANKVLNKLGNA
jgi:hypothetical protein